MKWLSYAVVVGILVEQVMSSPDYNQHAYNTKGRNGYTGLNVRFNYDLYFVHP